MRQPARTRTVAAAILIAASALAPAIAQQVDVNALGPQVGQKALPFNLPDQNGRMQSLETVAGPKGTMLVFFRSADW